MPWEADDNCKENSEEMGRLCIGIKGKLGKSIGRCLAVFHRDRISKKCAYKKAVEKVREKTEKREYWKTDNVT